MPMANSICLLDSVPSLSRLGWDFFFSFFFLFYCGWVGDLGGVLVGSSRSMIDGMDGDRAGYMYRWAAGVRA
jgi:hypothetical protein